MPYFARSPSGELVDQAAWPTPAEAAARVRAPQRGLGARPDMDGDAPPRARKGKFKGVKMSLGEFLTTAPEMLIRPPQLPLPPTRSPGERSAQREDLRRAGDQLPRLRVLGHAPTSEATEEEADHLQEVMDSLKVARQRGKARLTGALYNEGDPAAFKTKLDSYSGGLAATNITVGGVADALRDTPFYLHHDPQRLQTRILNEDGRHVYTLHAGASAFQPVPAAAVEGHAGRAVYSKIGSPGKHYVADDYGVPTRRHAYAVKSAYQLDRLAANGSITGRHAGDANRSADVPLQGELAELGEPPSDVRRLTDSELLYFHQEFGSGDRQRGVSATSTTKPLLSNAGDGFANTEVPGGVEGTTVMAQDPGARKLTIDTARIPPRGAAEPPVFVNYHRQIPGFRNPVTAPNLYETVRPQRNGPLVRKLGEDGRPILKYPAAPSQRHIDWSVGKNRELFIRRVTQPMVVASNHVAPAEAFVGSQTRDRERREQIRAGRELAARAEAERVVEERRVRREAEKAEARRNGLAKQAVASSSSSKQEKEPEVDPDE